MGRGNCRLVLRSLGGGGSFGRGKTEFLEVASRMYYASLSVERMEKWISGSPRKIRNLSFADGNVVQTTPGIDKLEVRLQGAETAANDLNKLFYRSGKARHGK